MEISQSFYAIDPLRYHAHMRILADNKAFASCCDRLAKAVAGQMAQTHADQPWALIGIRSRGDVLAQRIAGRLNAEQLAGRVGSLDITLYRDDLSEIGPSPVVKETSVPFGLDGLHVVLVDDVLMTGRSVRAAMQLMMDMGRPKRIWLSVLVDRGGRELPIAADHVAMDLTKDRSLKEDEQVRVLIQPTDPEDAIVVTERLRSGAASGGPST